jgi:hypothetical protein
MIIVSTEEGDNAGDLDDYRMTVHKVQYEGYIRFQKERRLSGGQNVLRYICKNICVMPGVVVHACNCSAQGLR